MRPCTIREDIARTKARYLLREYNILRPPVYPEDLAERMGIQIHYHLVDDVDFSFSLKKGIKYIIFVHISGNQGRDRWSVAHELGHIVLGHYELYRVDTVLYDRLTDRERYILDREADVFAEELLMPVEWVVKYRQKESDLRGLFKVSKEAISIRLNKLNYYTPIELS